MKFFKLEDFHELSRLHGGQYQNMGEYEAMAHCANSKRDKALEEARKIMQKGSNFGIEECTKWLIKWGGE